LNKIFEIARLHPELSLRVLAIRITDEEEFSVSESTVYRILKQNARIMSKPLAGMPARREWKYKTTRPDDLWHRDGTNLFAVS
jgi:hypothetical protein